MAAQLLIAATFDMIVAASRAVTAISIGALIFLFFVVASVVVTAVHEAGHAIAGVVVRFRIHQLSVGTGRTIASFSIGTTSIRLRTMLLGGGFVMGLTDRRRFYRTRATIFTAAGVVTPLALCWVTRGAWHASPPVRLFWGELVLVSLLTALACLYPHVTPEGAPTDGQQILDTWRMSDETVKARTRRTAADLNSFRWDDLIREGAGSGDPELAISLAAAGRRAVELEPDSWVAHHQGAVGFLIAGQYYEALPLAERALELGRDSDEPTEETHAGLRNNVAWALAVIGDPTTLDRATSLAEEAFALDPSSAIASTLGACLVQTGRAAEGEELVSAALSAAKSPEGRFQTHRLLTIAALERRDAFAARRAFGEAVAIASANGLDAERLLALRPRLGAAEAVLWLRRLDEQFLPTADDLGTDGPIIADALLAWIGPKHDNATRWNDFEAQGGHVASITEDRLQRLLSFSQSLVADRQQATHTAQSTQTTEPAHS